MLNLIHFNGSCLRRLEHGAETSEKSVGVPADIRTKRLEYKFEALPLVPDH